MITAETLQNEIVKTWEHMVRNMNTPPDLKSEKHKLAELTHILIYTHDRLRRLVRVSDAQEMRGEIIHLVKEINALSIGLTGADLTDE